MANAKISDTGVFLTGGVYNNITNINGLAGWSNNTGTNQNVAISGTQLVASLETNLYTTTPLPIAKGGTGINPAAPANVRGVPFVGALINEGSLIVGEQLVISADPTTGASVLNTIPNSFSFMVTVNQALPNIGYNGNEWNQPNVGGASWEQGATGGVFTKYTYTAANPKIRKSHFKEQEGNCELEMTLSLAGIASGTYDWELRLVDPLGVAGTQVVTSSAAVGATIVVNNFAGLGAGDWGAAWQQVRVTGVNLTYFADPSLPTEGELELYINGSQHANVGCSCRFMSN